MRWALSLVLLAACGPTQFAGDPDAGAVDAQLESADAARPDARQVDAAPPAPDAAAGAFAHTIVIDGANDFSSDERLATSSANFDAFVSWDADFLYFGMGGPDVASADNRRFLLIYIGTEDGTTEGETYNTQQPTLPFEAEYHVRWKADNTFTSAMELDGSVWTETDWDFTGQVFQSGEFVELRVSRADLELTSTAKVHLSMLNETELSEGTFAGAPSLSFSDGYDPNYAHYFEFDLSGSVPPASHVPLP